MACLKMKSLTLWHSKPHQWMNLWSLPTDDWHDWTVHGETPCLGTRHFSNFDFNARNKDLPTLYTFLYLSVNLNSQRWNQF